MTVLLISCILALLLLLAVVPFFGANLSDSGAHDPPISAVANPANDPDFATLADRLFSEQDWDFIRREGAPHLCKLFQKERRELAIHWLRRSAVQLRCIRKTHLENSRRATNLDLLAEARLLLLFFYLSFLLGFLLAVVRLFPPPVPLALLTHFLSLARPVFSAVTVSAPVTQRSL